MESSHSYDPEKGAQGVQSDPIQRPMTAEEKGRKGSIPGRKSSIAESVVAAELLDERYRTTQRGLKSRHAQMIALGGTIGTGYVKYLAF
jgi:amino acid permease